MTNNFLLNDNQYAQELYNLGAKDECIFDFHNHLDPKELFENNNYKSITNLWLDNDHYKWRAMRISGVNENLITERTNNSDYERFFAYLSTVENLIASPLYDWTRMELKNVFGITMDLCTKNAKKIFCECNEKLLLKEFTPIEILKKFNVKYLFTTNDPFDNLDYYYKLKNCGITILPTFRPDKLLQIGNTNWKSNLKKLEASENIVISNFEHFCDAIKMSLSRFVKIGCKLSDHSIEKAFFSSDKYFLEHGKEIAEKIFMLAIEEKNITEQDCINFESYMFLFLSKEYKKNNMVMQAHVGALRNVNSNMFFKLGCDSGFDVCGNLASSSFYSDFLNVLEQNDSLPKTIIYTLNSCDIETLASIAGSFCTDGIKNKVQPGCAWWFLDTKRGIERQLAVLAEYGFFPNMCGMVTDSRSVLSFVRHDYFRRILCSFVGKILEENRFENFDRATSIVKNICYKNSFDYFGS